ncbi:hypothetical protein JZ751_012730 [Albula glossodonta]|uniref:Uncharacterized protein n=1 Tax=Albula glossodonta TaxID=121402 RepID=A0A8T2N1Q8_9TELE|nr:hypothetical protein JZ751_012730 [Albula glossodonta]
MGKLQSKIRRRSDLYRSSREEEAESVAVNQVVQYDPAHTDAINCVTTISSDLCVSGGSDQVKCVPGTNRIFSASRDKSVLIWVADVHWVTG